MEKIQEDEIKNVIIETDITKLLLDDHEHYQSFIYCTKGTCEIKFNDEMFTLEPSTCTIVLNSDFLKDAKPMPDFECTILCIHENFMRQCGPHNPYIVHGALDLYNCPVIKLDSKQAELCRLLLYNFQLRINGVDHKFYNDILRASTEMFMLDIFDMHARINANRPSSISASSLMTRFIEMLEDKEYRNNREVAYYAQKLCVVPKYLSEVSNRVSGHSASYWINQYASRDISEVLRQNKSSVSEIAKMFHFTSASYFNRYVKRNLGAYPSDLRG